MTAALFQPLEIGSLTLPNRIVVAPMCQYSAENGSASDWHMMHLGSLSLSGAGLLILEATGVSPEARITAWDLGLYSDENEAALAQVIAAVRVHSDMPLAIQLAHAGRKASSAKPWDGGHQIPATDPMGWRTRAPSAVPHSDGEEAPEALDADGLKKVVDDFVAAARRSVRLGLQGIELHAAHGYLLHQFLSPIANRRDDAYGGSQENRMRFPLEVFDAVKAAVPADVPVWVRVSASDWVEGGWDIDGTIAFSKALEARGCAAMHISSGGVSPLQSIPIGPGYQVHFAEAVKKAVSIPVMGVGLITEAQQAEQVLQAGQADAVALARAMLYDPRWPWHAAAELGASVTAPPQYFRCQPHGLNQLFHAASHGQR
ncbi:NADH:flavin oxidoreductase/NADH oxidase [Fulvimarina sp. 2208YS6-2-32]|uniref:NADH:flavin oxidoreductase/NADH oxidase n=1 Tax=Fulvimarina uroteuthidis TaxID=3098149 RepID=A0ABU5HZ62_9HYPH|nr:NADH:flavin oxidoreductase/NADH oxidase [Fulvimarina sp. 2208YS6-2-32]MDY8108335.1 NADH:flavin oxidoreductase/NADH oxidase [Fulvimarina sp. 2208YS6-2-32]